ncbi:MAG: heme-binding domain-containing protein [Bdellovibrionales bacterium]|nr:heme-binding domain-containing protein [Bdellovibrionales bacterium]
MKNGVLKQLKSGRYRAQLSAFVGGMTLLTAWALAHGPNKHNVEDPGVTSDETKQKMALDEINASYLNDVKPIFENKCANCHSDHPRYPWYSSLPGVNQLITDDIKEAKTHLDISRDFPFQGHGSPETDLTAIKEAVDKGTMPPLRYRIMHWGSNIDPEEKEKIFDWVAKSQQKLQFRAGEKE